MKNLILPIAIGLVLFTSCSKDESLEQIETQDINYVHVLNQNNETSFWETKIIDNTQIGAKYEDEPNLTYQNYTEGLYMSAPQNGMTLQWRGSNNDNGAHGMAEFKQIAPWVNLHFKMETECITVVGNEAVYGGNISEVIALLGEAPDIGVGWRFYFKVTDNDQGGFAPYDQISNVTIFASPRSISLCNVYLPNDNIWSTQGYTDVTKPGFVVMSSNEND